MATVTVYQFEKYDIASDGMLKSKRWGTREAIKTVGGSIIEGKSAEVDDVIVRSDIQGMTARGHDPFAFSRPGVMR